MLMLASSQQSLDTRFHLVRHGAHAELGRVLSGRAGSISLNEEGRLQAEAVSAWAGLNDVDAIHCSPRRRTLETASIIADALGLKVEIADALDEVDFGSWNGMAFAELDGDPLWHAWNCDRASSITPGGETMAQAVGRGVHYLESVTKTQPGATILCVTHCDIIRGMIAHYLGLSLNNLLKFNIDPGSVSTVTLGPVGERVTRVNEVPA
jgi:ribonuclease H / adenosylcobalamin/alpha-ribazole phosphatase